MVSQPAIEFAKQVQSGNSGPIASLTYHCAQRRIEGESTGKIGQRSCLLSISSPDVTLAVGQLACLLTRNPRLDSTIGLRVSPLNPFVVLYLSYDIICSPQLRVNEMRNCRLVQIASTAYLAN